MEALAPLLAGAGPHAMVIAAVALVQAGVVAIGAKRPRMVLQVACACVQLAAAVLWLLAL